MVDRTPCALDGCDNFIPEGARHGQKYCSTECTKKANNNRAIARYHERKALIASGKRKVCATAGCKTILRKTSESKYCDPCQSRDKYNLEKEIRRRILGTD